MSEPEIVTSPAKFKLSVLVDETVTELKVVDEGDPLRVPLEFHVNVPPVKLMVPLFVKSPRTEKPIAPDKLAPLFTMILLKVRTAPETAVVPLKTTVPPLLFRVPAPLRLPAILIMPAGAVKAPEITTAFSEIDPPLLVSVVDPPKVKVPAVKAIDPLVPKVKSPLIREAVAVD